VGLPLPGVEVRLEGSLDRPPLAGEEGQLFVRGPSVFAGYWERPAATAATFADGWFATGDVVAVDGDGYLSVRGRRGDLVISGGFNVYPAEVEQVLARLDGVAGAAVIGVPHDRLGEVGKAYVVPRPGRVLDADQVLAFCRARLAGYKLPRQVEFRGDLPRNSSGKVLKRQLREESR
jgi:acyl-CoA synthetase (AMP-forming)/AMP-acid ligase II